MRHLLVVFLLLLPGLIRAQDASEETFLTFAEELTWSLNDGDPSYLDARFRFDLLVSRILEEEGFPEDFILGAMRGVAGRGMGQTLIPQMRPEGYHFLRLRTRDGQPSALFRFLNNDGAVNYHEYYLRMEGDSVRVDDIFVFATGEDLSESLRRELLSMRTIIDAESMPEEEQQFWQIMTLIGQQQHDQALALYPTLAPTVQDRQSLLLWYLGNIHDLSKEAYDKAFTRFLALYPNNSALHLHLIDRHYMDGNLPAALASIHEVEQLVGGDAYLDFLRGTLHYTLDGDRKEAVAALNEAIAKEPTLEDPYWSLVTLSLEEENYDETIRLFDLIESELYFEMVPELIEAEPLYAGFVQSEAYQQWLAARKNG